MATRLLLVSLWWGGEQIAEVVGGSGIFWGERQPTMRSKTRFTTVEERWGSATLVCWGCWVELGGDLRAVYYD